MCWWLHRKRLANQTSLPMDQVGAVQPPVIERPNDSDVAYAIGTFTSLIPSDRALTLTLPIHVNPSELPPVSCDLERAIFLASQSARAHIGHLLREFYITHHEFAASPPQQPPLPPSSDEPRSCVPCLSLGGADLRLDVLSMKLLPDHAPMNQQEVAARSAQVMRESWARRKNKDGMFVAFLDTPGCIGAHQTLDWHWMDKYAIQDYLPQCVTIRTRALRSASDAGFLKIGIIVNIRPVHALVQTHHVSVLRTTVAYLPIASCTSQHIEKLTTQLSAQARQTLDRIQTLTSRVMPALPWTLELAAVTTFLQGRGAKLGTLRTWDCSVVQRWWQQLHEDDRDLTASLAFRMSARLTRLHPPFLTPQPHGRASRLCICSSTREVVSASLLVGAGVPARHGWCARCQLVFYCSPKCQHADWPNHKKRCATNKRKVEVARGLLRAWRVVISESLEHDDHVVAWSDPGGDVME